MVCLMYHKQLHSNMQSENLTLILQVLRGEDGENRVFSDGVLTSV